MSEKTLLGFAFICPKCKETASKSDLIVINGKLEWCKACKCHCIAVSIYKEDIEGK
ncbi:unnamed protein product [marine sediment metagenome]|uniref:Uncharacterized protein n=1 Tax=marine sediment metagenome TaxID=412755 RepID=X0WGS8_9ZZZZ